LSTDIKTNTIIRFNKYGFVQPEQTNTHSDGSLNMIHASSSKGIEITNVDISNYWQKKLVGFGTYVKD
jgi:cell wall-associated NlpC family hydrolase